MGVLEFIQGYGIGGPQCQRTPTAKSYGINDYFLLRGIVENSLNRFLWSSDDIARLIFTKTPSGRWRAIIWQIDARADSASFVKCRENHFCHSYQQAAVRDIVASGDAPFLNQPAYEVAISPLRGKVNLGWRAILAAL